MHRVLSIKPDSQGIEIGSFTIDDDSPTLTIAEIGINHNGCLALAKDLVDEAVCAGAHCAKFQMRSMRNLYRNGGDASDSQEDIGSQYILDVLSKSQLGVDAMFEVFSYCERRGIVPLCTPWDTASVAALEQYGMAAYKVASADLTNPDLITAIAATGKPMILSTGMSAEWEIKEAVSLLKRLGAAYALLHCVSTYPAPFKDLNLRYLNHLKTLGDCPVGYSGHERGYHVALAAVTLGAKLVEKHFTLDKNMDGNDHKISLLPKEFAEMVQCIREIEEAMGSDAPKRITQGEKMNREVLAKSLVANRNLSPGDIIGREDVDVKSPGKGLQPNLFPELIGTRVKRNIPHGDFFFPSDLENDTLEPSAYHFRRSWGVPVRYHDVEQLCAMAPSLNFVEFHLSYKDLDLSPSDYITRPRNIGLAVHSPDLFPGDHLLNLAAEDKATRVRSITDIQRVIDLARYLKTFFTIPQLPVVIVSVGGFSRDAPLPYSEKPRLYEQVARSLDYLDCSGVTLAIQTLPPFPWYLGGQMYCNIFVDPNDTAEFCENTRAHLCLDLSHSKLAANYLGISFATCLRILAPHAVHLHVVDAAGTSEEGLQIGEGEIDFAEAAQILDDLCPTAGFIPEIWQGHKDGGRGFWEALERLTHWF